MEEKNQTENAVAKLCKGIAGLFFGMMFWGIGEIIRLLHEGAVARSCPPKKDSL